MIVCSVETGREWDWNGEKFCKPRWGPTITILKFWALWSFSICTSALFNWVKWVRFKGTVQMNRSIERDRWLSSVKENNTASPLTQWYSLQSCHMQLSSNSGLLYYYMTLDHKTSHKPHRYICIWVKMIYFSLKQKCIRIWSKDLVPWRYFVNFLP